MNYRRATLEIFAFAAFFIAIVVVLANYSYPSQVILGGKVFRVEVVDTEALLQKGLSGHAPLQNNEGMFFVFQTPDNYGFWMKDMTFPIDIIWMDQNFKITHIESRVSPDTYPKIFYPNANSLYVLEISAGEASSLGVGVGGMVTFVRNSGRFGL